MNKDTKAIDLSVISNIKKRNIIMHLYDNIVWYTERLFFRTKRIFQFIKLGYNDFDWDYDNLIFLLTWKMEQMEKYFRESTIVNDSKEVAEQLKEVRELLIDVFENFEYDEDAFKKHEEKYGKRISYSEDNGKGFYKFHYYYEKIDKNDLALIEQADRESIEIYLSDDKKRESKKRKAFYLLYKNIEGWWD